MSKALKPSERRYSAYERELLGIVWAIEKWQHYLEGRHFVVQTDHSSLRHLPNQPSVNRRIWKWVSILHGYNIEIKHIPGKINPADALTRQIQIQDVEYANEVKREDQDWVQNLRISPDADDTIIQQKLNDLYSKASLQDQKQRAMQCILPDVQTEQCAVLAVSQSSVSIDSTMKQRMMTELRNDDQYSTIIDLLEDPNQPNEVQRNEKKYRI